MSTFDIDSYFANKAAAAGDTISKFDELAAASEAKAASLGAMRADAEKYTAQRIARREAEVELQKNSWSGQLGLGPDTFLSNRVNDAASLVSGASRLAGQTISLPFNASGAIDALSLSEDDIAAFNRYNTNQVFPGDMDRLSRKPNPNAPSLLDRIQGTQRAFETGRKINDTFDLTKIVDPSNRAGLAQDLGRDFDRSWGQVTEGWQQGQEGNLGTAAAGVTKGLASLLANAGSAILSNPAGVREYILENAPQLLLGAFGKAGQAGMLASNLGYALDTFQEGVENYAKANAGQLPPQEELQRMAVLSASLAGAEQASDMVSLGAAKLLGRATKEISRNAFKNTLKAGAQGFASEAPTEGYQTWAEGEITGKPASAQDIYTGAVIGGAAGGGLVGGLRLASELTGTTPEQVEERANQQRQRVTRASAVNAAVETGDVTPLLDAQSKAYSPESAIAVLQVRATRPETTEEEKEQAQVQAKEILDSLVTQKSDIESQISLATVKNIKATIATKEQELADVDPQNTEEVARLTQQLDIYKQELVATEEAEAADPQAAKKADQDAANLRQQLSGLEKRIETSSEAYRIFQFETRLKNLDPEAEAAKITSENPEQSQKTADDIITLFMEAPSRVNPALAASLADNVDNGLREDQRQTLRILSREKQLENSLKGMNVVSGNISVGEKGKYVGLVEYKKNITNFINQGNRETADKQLAQLARFANSHEQKTKLVSQAYRDYASDGVGRVVFRKKNGTWDVQPGSWSEEERKKNGAVNIDQNTGNLRDRINLEAQMVSATHALLKRRRDMKFSPGNVVTPTTKVAPTNVSQAAQTVQSQTQGPQVSAAAAATGTVSGAGATIAAPELSGSGSPAATGSGSGSVEAAGVTPSNLPRVQVGVQVDGWLNQNAQVARDTADKRGLTAEIEQQFADGKTVSEVQASLGKKLDFLPIEERTGFVVSVRATLGIPSQQSAEGQAEFAEWKAARTARLAQQSATPATATTSQDVNAEAQTDAEIAAEASGSAAVVTQEAQPAASTPGFDQDDPGPDFNLESNEDTEATNSVEVDPRDSNNQDAEVTADTAENETATTDTEALTPQKRPEDATQITEPPSDELSDNAAPDFMPVDDFKAVDSTTTLPEEEGALAAMAVKAVEPKSIRDKRAGDFFTQVATNDVDASPRPLVVVRNFVSRWSNGAVQAMDYLRDKTPFTDNQMTAIAAFQKKVVEWSGQISNNLFLYSQNGFAYRDPIQFFINRETANGKERLDVEENLKSAIVAAIFSVTSDLASRGTLNDSEGINTILRRSRESLVSDAELAFFGPIGNYQSILIDSLGSKIIDALGIRALKNKTPKDVYAKLRVSLGSHALKLMLDKGLVERTAVPTSVMQTFMGELVDPNVDARIDKEHSFYKLVRDEDRRPAGPAKEIVDAVSGSQTILDRIFGMESAIRYPSLEPVTDSQKFSDTGMKVPSLVDEVNKAGQTKVEWKVSSTPYGLLTRLAEQFQDEMIGVREVTEKNTHKVRRLSQEAANDGKRRELGHLRDFVEFYLKDTNVGFFLSLDMWKQQRAGFQNNAVNPQTSKSVRQLIAPKEWDTEIHLDSASDMTKFMLRVLEGFGQKTEQKFVAANLKDLDAKLAHPNIQEGVQAIRFALSNPDSDLSLTQQAAISRAVRQGGQNLHTFTALVAYSQYLNAKDLGATSFTTNLMQEIDGISNGSILNTILYGINTVTQSIESLLERGGIYTLDSDFRQYNEYRGTSGNLDIYESNAKQTFGFLNWTIGKTIKGLFRSPELIAAFWETGGHLVNEQTGEVQKTGRNLLKSAINPLNYGAGFDSLFRNMAGDYVETLYGRFEKFSERGVVTPQDKAEFNTFVEAINTILEAGDAPVLPVGNDISWYMNFEFKDKRFAALQNIHREVIGGAVQNVVKKNFGSFLEKAKLVTTATNLSYDLYDIVYQDMRRQMIEKLGIPLVQKGEFAGQPIHDLTEAQEDEIKRSLAKAGLYPLMHTAMSKADNDLGAGILAATKENLPNTDAAYQAEIRFAQPLPANSGEKPTKQITARGRSAVQQGPGVMVISAQTHSTDSAMLQETRKEFPHTLPLHDAVGAGIGQMEAIARKYNQQVWDKAFAHSPMSEAYDTLLRTLRALDKLGAEGKLTDAVNKQVTQVFSSIGKDKLDIRQFAALLYRQAVIADRTKYGAMSTWATIDQFAYIGGEGMYTVTDKNRAAAVEAKNALSFSVPMLDLALINKIFPIVQAGQKTNGQEEAGLTTAFGPLGGSLIESDPNLEGFFRSRKDGVFTAQEVAKHLLANGDLDALNKKILTLVARVLGKADPNLKIRYITKDTDPASLVGQPQSARGWYVAEKDGQTEIYVLASEFQNSGLTNETVLHELVHGALARTIASVLKNQSKPENAEALALINELELLRTKARAYVQKKKLGDGFKPALDSLQEFVAWGMTNQEFQVQVLANLRMRSGTAGNSLVSGLKEFIRNVAKLIFRNPDEELENGLNILVANVSGLLAQAQQTPSENVDSLVQLQESVNAVSAYTTTELFDALSNGAVSVPFANHLRNVLGNIVNALHGPFGAFAEQMKRTEAGNPLSTWLKTLETGKAPFASEIIASGLQGSVQEDFVAQQVEMTVKAALQRRENTASALYKELSKLFDEARVALKNAPGLTADEYQFLFEIRADGGDRSDYLARFAAIGLSNERINNLLKFETFRDSKKLFEGKSIADRLMRFMERVLAFFNERVFKVFGGQQADEKLESLVSQLVDMEARKLQGLIQQTAGSKFVMAFDNKAKSLIDAARNRVADVADSRLLKKTGITFIRAGSKLVSILAQDRADEFMKQIRKMRDQSFNERDGFLTSFLSEFKGPEQAFQALIRAMKHMESLRKDIRSQQSKLVLNSFVNGEAFTQEQSRSVTTTFMRTGMHYLLDRFSLAELDALIDDSNTRDAAIGRLLAQLPQKWRSQYQEQAHALGAFKAQGVADTQVLLYNAYAISRLFEMAPSGSITEVEAKAAEPTIAALVALYGLRYTSQADRNAARDILRTESARTDGGNGVEFVLRLHKQLEAESLERLFNGNPAQMIHGYTPDITNPYKSVLVAGADEGQDLEDQGYRKVGLVEKDRLDDRTGQRFMYVLDDGGLSPHVTAAFSLTSEQSRGTNINNGFLDIETTSGLANASQLADIRAVRLKASAVRRDPNRNMTHKRNHMLAPIFNDRGEITNWRYLMKESTKDAVLERDNRFEQIIGTLASSIFDKETSKILNTKAIKVLREQYTLDYTNNPSAYIEIGPDSLSTEMSDLWRLLPDATQQEIRDVWGSDAMWVRKDSVTPLFGYRKFSLADEFRKDPELRKGLVKFVAKFVEFLFKEYAQVRLGYDEDRAKRYAKRAANVVARGERVWQEVVSEIKDIIVVRTGIVLFGNIVSNFSLLAIQGVPMRDVLKHHLVAIRAATEYKKNSERLTDLETLLSTNMAGARTREYQQEVLRLRDAISRNPVKPLIDEGLMPSIVDDVSMDEDIYSYKSEYTRKLEKYTDMLNPMIKTVAKNVYMTRDTWMHQTLFRTTQLSDFVARYTLYQHLISRKDNPLSHKQAVQEASDSFVNYDIPMHKMLQYTDDMGITMFTKYFLRIQRVLLKTMKENPSRVLGLLLLNNYLDLSSTVLDSSLINHLGNNPVHSGPLQIVGAVNNLASVEAMMKLIK